jgi:hypothetical protein
MSGIKHLAFGLAEQREQNECDIRLVAETRAQFVGGVSHCELSDHSVEAFGLRSEDRLASVMRSCPFDPLA